MMQSIMRFSNRVSFWRVLLLAAVVSGAGIAQSSEDMEKIDETIHLIDELRSAIDRSQFDLELLLDRLEYDSTAIVDFVTTEIRYEQYPGLLRGPLGTLISRAGNALDQAVLAARLLNDAGFDARILRGKLTDEQALTLLQTLGRNTPSPSIGDHERLETALSELRALYPNDARDAQGMAPPSRERIRQLALLHERFLLDTLHMNEMELAPHRIARSLINEARDYFWVEFRNGANEKWTQIHPVVVAEMPSLGEIQVNQYMTSDIPKDLQQRIRIAAFIKRKFGDEVHVDPVMSPWERPAANLQDVLVRYTSFPNRFGEITEAILPEQIDELLQESTLLVPRLNGDVPSGAMAFDLLGNLAPSDVASSEYAALFQSVGTLFGNADDLLSNETGSEPSDLRRGLLEHWLEVSILVPGRPERIVKRTLFSRGENVADAPRHLSQETILTVRLGAPLLSKILDGALQQLHTQFSFTKSFVSSNQQGKAAEWPVIQKKLNDLDMIWGYYLWAHYWPDEMASGISYLSEPFLVANHTHVLLANTRFSGMDVISNRRRSFVFDGDDLLSDPRLSLKAGVKETVAEYVTGNRADGAFNTISEFDRLLASRTKTEVVADGEALKVLSNISGITRMAMSRDLDSGFVIVPAPSSSSAPGLTAWWRVDPATGETLGMGTPGWGINLTQYSTLQQEKRAECLAEVAMFCRISIPVSKATAILQKIINNAGTIDQAATLAIRAGAAAVGAPAAPGVSWGGGVAASLATAVDRFGVDRAYRQCVATFSAACYLL